MKLKDKKLYFIGIKGVGMTMLAQFLAHQNNQISGSDISDVFLTDKVLLAENISILSPFNEKNIPSDADIIIYSSAFSENNNCEMAYLANLPKKAKSKIKILSYAEALGATFNNYYGLAVCGSHGKTTTSAWLGYVLWCAGKKPNVLVGSNVPQFKGSSLVGDSRYFLAEVDEYQNKLQYFKPHGIILNNIDYDHPDFFKDPRAYRKVFIDFIKKVPIKGFLVINNRDSEIQKIKKYCPGKIISYDFVSAGHIPIHSDYLAYYLRNTGDYQTFRVINHGDDLGEFKIQLWGEHNVLNALAVISAARELKVPLNKIKKYLAEFKGTERRMQALGKFKGALIFDDYAHHPTEIKATLASLRVHYPTKKIITVFHPHTFTRTKALFDDFVSSFANTDELFILDIYGSAREKQGGVSSRELVAAIKEFNKEEDIKQKVANIA
ncbi:MAG: UDP-N-acetylmuramate--L-alanine ligase, partial [Patescibacteria group bacterium]